MDLAFTSDNRSVLQLCRNGTSKLHFEVDSVEKYKKKHLGVSYGEKMTARFNQKMFNHYRSAKNHCHCTSQQFDWFLKMVPPSGILRRSCCSYNSARQLPRKTSEVFKHGLTACMSCHNCCYEQVSLTTHKYPRSNLY